jgi:drug/metabolite transporter (DMT)-like permease
VTGETQPYAAEDWGRVGLVAALWGCSFLFIDIGLDHLAPGVVAFARVALGAATLAALPVARRAVPAGDWGWIAVLGVTWMAVPMLLFPVAEQWVDSSLAGMINGATPLATAAVAALVLRRAPGRRTAAGLVLGIAGVTVVSWPALGAASSTALGAALLLVATLLYGVAFNVAAPLQRRHGALPVLLRAQLVALVLLAPVGLAGVERSEFAWSSVLAMLALGCGGTAVAFAAFTTLAGRVGSTRASITIYLLPPVAILAGAAFRDEAIGVSALVGTALVLAGAAIAGREGATRARRSAPRCPPAARAPARSPARG